MQGTREYGYDALGGQPSCDARATRETTPLRAWASFVGSGLASGAVAAAAATLAIEATPHARGVGFFPQLRFAMVAPASLLAGLLGAGLYPVMVRRAARPRLAFPGVAMGAAVALLLGVGAFGPPALLAAAAPPALTAAVVVALLVPRLSTGRPRSGVGSLALALLTLMELFGVAKGLASEPGAPGTPAEVASQIPRTLFDVEHRFLDLPSGARVHYVDEGTGETLLFLHGNPSWSFQWRDLIRGLKGSYRCVALDYPGFGLSTTSAPGFGYTPRQQSQVVEEFVERLGLHDITLVMQDWGGPIGFGFAGRRPELVRALVLGNTWAWQTSTSEARGKWSVVAGGPIGEFLQMNFNGVAAFGLEKSVVHPLPSDVLGTYERPFLPLEGRGVATLYPQQITAATDYFDEVERGLGQLADRRALIFWGLQDVGFPRADLERWERVLPRHEVVELPHANHFFFEDSVDEVVTRIRAFVPGHAGM